MTKKRTSDPRQVRQSEANRALNGEFRLTVSTWVDAEQKDEAREAAKAAIERAVKKYKK